jgi:hypothetical protein
VAPATPATGGDVGGSSSLPRHEAEVTVIPSSTEEGENHVAAEGVGKELVVEASVDDTPVADKAANAGGSPLCITETSEKEATSSVPPSSVPSSGPLSKAVVLHARKCRKARTDAFYVKVQKGYGYLRENFKVQDLSLLYFFLHSRARPAGQPRTPRSQPGWLDRPSSLRSERPRKQCTIRCNSSASSRPNRVVWH